MDYRLNVSMLAVQDGKILMLQRADYDSFLPGYWEFPGGAVEEGEGFEEAAKREFEEECGCKIAVKEAVTSFIYYIGTELHVEVAFKAEIIEGHVDLSPEHQAYDWVTNDTISSHPSSPEIRKIFDQVMNE